METYILSFVICGVITTVIFIIKESTRLEEKIDNMQLGVKVLYKIVGKNEKYGDYEAEKEAYLPLSPFPGLIVGLHFNLPNGNEWTQTAEVTEIYWKEKTKIVKIVLDHVTSDIETLKASGWKVFAVANMVYSEI